MNTYLENLQWRYATKRMNGQPVEQNALQNILEAIRLAPTSLGMQPFKVLVVQSKEAKEKLFLACNQPQIKESHTVLIFCRWKYFTAEQVHDYMQNIVQTRGVTKESLQGFQNMILDTIQNNSQEFLDNWASRQIYIALGFGLFAAAMEKVDSTPMEGFDPKKLDEVFQLPEKGLHSTVLLAIGHRDPQTDYLVNQKKVRRSHDKLFEFLP